jgi:23S rRNA (uridine2552-2'-O)-methyltransferase
VGADGKRRRVHADPVAAADVRATPERVKTARKRTEQSARWLERQLNDPYVKRAKAEGWRSRAAYKLIELHEKYGIIRRGDLVVDLGVAPGGWAQVALARGAAKVVGIDLLAVDPIPGVELIQGDFLDEDMPANTVGHRATDHLRTVALAEAAAQFALDTLAPGGTFVTKVFQGGSGSTLLAGLKQAFTEVRHAKPPASRAESVELYLVAKGRR